MTGFSVINYIGNINLKYLFCREILQESIALLYLEKKIMKKIRFIIITLIIFVNGITAQSKTNSIGSVVIHYLENHQADSIYVLTGQAFKDRISKENFKNISENQLFSINDFKTVTFIKMQNGINKYKIKGTPELQLLVGLDAQNKIQTLQIQPYRED